MSTDIPKIVSHKHGPGSCAEITLISFVQHAFPGTPSSDYCSVGLLKFDILMSAGDDSLVVLS